MWVCDKDGNRTLFDGHGQLLQRVFIPFAFGDIAESPNPPVIDTVIVNDRSGITVENRSIIELNLVSARLAGMRIEVEDFVQEGLAVLNK